MSSKIDTPKTKTPKAAKATTATKPTKAAGGPKKLAAVAEKPASETPAPAKEKKEKKTPVETKEKKQTVPTFTKIDGSRGVFINHTRVKHYLSDGLNPGFKAALDDIKKLEKENKSLDKAQASTRELLDSIPEPKPSKKGDEAKKTAEKKTRSKFANEIEKIKNSAIRFSKTGHMYTAAAIDESLAQFLEYGMTKMDGAKTLTVSHLLGEHSEGSYTKLPLSPLYSQLPCVLKVKEHVDALAAAKKTSDKKTTDTPTPVEKKEDDRDSDDKQQGFGHYVRQVFGNIKQKKIAAGDADAAVLRISKDVETLGSDIVIDFLKRLIPLIRAQVDSKGVKTLNDKIMSLIISNIVGYQTGVNIVEFEKLIDDKVTKLQGWIKEKASEKKSSKEAKKSSETGEPGEDAENEDEEEDDE